MRLRALSALAVMTVLLGLAACGNTSNKNGVASAGSGAAAPAATASPSMDPRDAQLRFAQCMRENGIQVADPEPGKPFQVNGGADPAKLQAAQKKCGPILQAGGMGPNANDPAEQDAMVKFAQCMRAHGVDVPDPQAGQGLKLQAPNVSQEQAEAAQKACQQYLPGAGSPSWGSR